MVRRAHWRDPFSDEIGLRQVGEDVTAGDAGVVFEIDEIVAVVAAEKFHVQGRRAPAARANKAAWGKYHIFEPGSHEDGTGLFRHWQYCARLSR